jgi:tRNA U34 2-thiouridine synthase MnmA/TrmU
MTRAIVLLSGGLDSCLAVSVLRKQGIEVVAVNFQTPFCQDGGTGASCGSATKVADALGLPLRVLFLGDEFLRIVENPPHGHGKNMNPCIDCRILMLKRAGELMEAVGAKFVATGEVVGQRPMSQHLTAMKEVEKECGLTGLVLRPLCAKLLDPTIPEMEGWVDREGLLSLSGRTRKEQFRMAKELGLSYTPSPAGGCLLTDPAYANRLRDFLAHGGRLTAHSATLLRQGRYFRLSDSAILMVGRNKAENDQLEGLQDETETIWRQVDCLGPVAVGQGDFSGDLGGKAAELVAKYTDPPAGGVVTLEIRKGRDGEPQRLAVSVPSIPAVAA